MNSNKQMDMSSIIVAVLALAFSCYTFFAHDRRLKKQDKLLNEYQLRLMARSEEESKKAVIRAKSVKYTNGRRTLFIYNTGTSKARNLKVDMLDNDQVIASRPDLPQTYEELLPNASREILLLLTDGDDEITLIYEWDDDFRKENKESQTIDL